MAGVTDTHSSPPAQAPAPGAPPRWTEYMYVDELQSAPRNPKLHDQDALGYLIDHHGFVEAPTLDERTGRLVAGHGRRDQLLAKQAAGEDPPDGILVGDDGRWMTPVQRGWRSRSDADAEAYVVGSNESTIRGGYDERLLLAVAHDLDAAGLLAAAAVDQEKYEDLLKQHGNPFDWAQAGSKDGEAREATPPDEFPAYGDDIVTAYQCPACGYEWSGKPHGDSGAQGDDE